MGAELLVSCQIVYLSNCFYTNPSFLFDSIKTFGLVTGGWPIFFAEEDKSVLFPLTARVQLNSSFFEGSKIAGGLLLVSVVTCIIILVFCAIMKKI